MYVPWRPWRNGGPSLIPLMFWHLYNFETSSAMYSWWKKIMWNVEYLFASGKLTEVSRACTCVNETISSGHAAFDVFRNNRVPGVTLSQVNVIWRATCMIGARMVHWLILLKGLWKLWCSGKTSLLFQYAYSVCMADPEAIIVFIGKQSKLEEDPPCLPKVWTSFWSGCYSYEILIANAFPCAPEVAKTFVLFLASKAYNCPPSLILDY